MIRNYKHKHMLNKIRHKRIEWVVEIGGAKVGPTSISTIRKINAS